MSSSGAEEPMLVRFFDPKVGAKDFAGRTLEDILGFTDNELEQGHDYVQILFPLPEGSAFNWKSPIVDNSTFEAFRARDDLRTSLARAFKRMMAFYGFDTTSPDLEHVELSRSSNHMACFSNWVVRMDQ
jgi:hypothetical protein